MITIRYIIIKVKDIVYYWYLSSILYSYNIVLIDYISRFYFYILIYVFCTSEFKYGQRTSFIYYEYKGLLRLLPWWDIINFT